MKVVLVSSCMSLSTFSPAGPVFSGLDPTAPKLLSRSILVFGAALARSVLVLDLDGVGRIDQAIIIHGRQLPSGQQVHVAKDLTPHSAPVGARGGAGPRSIPGFNGESIEKSDDSMSASPCQVLPLGWRQKEAKQEEAHAEGWGPLQPCLVIILGGLPSPAASVIRGKMVAVRTTARMCRTSEFWVCSREIASSQRMVWNLAGACLYHYSNRFRSKHHFFNLLLSPPSHPIPQSGTVFMSSFFCTSNRTSSPDEASKTWHS